MKNNILFKSVLIHAVGAFGKVFYFCNISLKNTFLRLNYPKLN